MTPHEGISPNEEDIVMKDDQKDDQAEAEDREQSDERIDKLNEAFDDLMDKVKDAPEARQEALRILIEDMRQQAEHLAQVRDIKNFNELKREMIRQWRKLENAAGSDPAMLEAIQSWGEDFITEKLIYHDMVAEVKDELADKATEVQDSVTDIKSIMGQIAGLVEAAGAIHLDQAGSSERVGKMMGKDTPFEKFLDSLTALEKGYDASDIDMNAGHDFLRGLQEALRELIKAAHDRGDRYNTESRKIEQTIPVEEYPQIKDRIEELKKKMKELSAKINEASKIFKVIKKIKDERFLPLMNRPGPQAEKEAA